MGTDRLAMFSDAVLAIILTIMVLEFEVPHGATTHALQPLLPVFLSYVLSFLYLGLYWINHHNLLHQRVVDGRVLWANLHLLFWLSLLPFTTRWMGQNYESPVPTAFYGAVLFAAAVAYEILQRTLSRLESAAPPPSGLLGPDWKPKLSISLYLAGIGAAAVNPGLGQLFFVAGAVWWIMPDRRVLPSWRVAP